MAAAPLHMHLSERPEQNNVTFYTATGPSRRVAVVVGISTLQLATLGQITLNQDY
jgi:hypothetical protein